MSNFFGKDDLITLCFQLGIDNEKMEYGSKDALAREIIKYCRKNDIDERLMNLIIEKRPFLFQPIK